MSDKELTGIRVPPVLHFLSFLVVGILLDRLRPAPFLPTAVARLLGAGIMSLAFATLAWAGLHLRRANTTHDHHVHSTAMVSEGPFRISRNPIYLGLLGLMIGLAFRGNSLWLLAMVVPPFIVLNRWVVPREEAYLERMFGDAYRRYLRNVRRWL